MNIYKALEDQVAGRDEEIFFPDEDKWSLSTKPLREFFQRQYEMDLEDGAYKYGAEDQVEIEIKEDQADFVFGENQIGLVSFPELIGLRDLETYGTYGFLKVGLLSTEGYYATDFQYKDNSYKNILITKTRDSSGQVRFIPFYVSDQDLDSIKVKELIEEFKMTRKEVPADESQVKAQEEEILSKEETDKALDQNELVNKD